MPLFAAMLMPYAAIFHTPYATPYAIITRHMPIIAMPLPQRHALFRITSAAAYVSPPFFAT